MFFNAGRQVLRTEFLDDLFNRFARIPMPGDRTANYQIIRTRLDRLPRSHDPFLIAGFRPAWPDSRHDHRNGLAKRLSQALNFPRARHQTGDSSGDTETAKAQDMVFDSIGNARFSQGLFIRTGQHRDPEQIANRSLALRPPPEPSVSPPLR